MECILGAPAPADFGRLIRLQKEAVLAKVRSMTCSHMTHPGLAAFKPGGSHAALRPGGIRTPLPPASIPGLRDAGWAPQPPRYRLVLPGLADGGAPTAGNVRAWQRALLQAVVDHPDSWPFRAPVDPAVVLDYYEVVREPMDLATIGQRVDAGDYYATLELFAADFRRIFTNARLYNAPDTPYFKLANKVRGWGGRKGEQFDRDWIWGVGGWVEHMRSLPLRVGGSLRPHPPPPPQCEAFWESKVAATLSWSKRGPPVAL